MRLKNLPNLLKITRLIKLRKDFTNPFTALVAASGITNKMFKLHTINGASLNVNRNDTPLWKEYFSADLCDIKIEDDLFHIISKSNNFKDFYVKGSNNLFTYKPERWSTNKNIPELLKEFEEKEKKVYSQHGEDGVLQYLISKIPVSNNFIVEFGAHDGLNMSNSRYLIERYNWKAFLIEADPRYFNKLDLLYDENIDVITQKIFLTKENINKIFHNANVPIDFDILSIDVDGPDYYLWEALTDFRPSIVIVEYNSAIDSSTEYIVNEENAIKYGGTSEEGASLLSLCKLGELKGYIPIYTELSGSNLFFVHKDYANLFNLKDINPHTLYQPPQFGSLCSGKAPNGRGYI